MKYLLLSLLFITTAQANVSGHWSGEAVLDFNERSDDCILNISLTETVDTFSRFNTTLKCQVNNWSLVSSDWKIAGKDILDDNDEVVGSYSEEEITFTEVDHDGTQTWTSISVKGDKIKFDEVSTDGLGDPIYSIRAFLSK